MLRMWVLIGAGLSRVERPDEQENMQQTDGDKHDDFEQKKCSRTTGIVPVISKTHDNFC